MAQSKKLKTSHITSFFKRREDDQPSTSAPVPVLPDEKEPDQPEPDNQSADNSHDDQTDDEETVGLKEDECLDSWGEPNHPLAKSIPPKERKTQKVFFQEKWFKMYPWLHFQPSIGKVVCFQCSKAEDSGHLKTVKSKEPAFLTSGFDNWKKAQQRFEHHQASDCHKVAMASSTKSQPKVNTALNSSIRKQQTIARNALVKVFKCLRYLLRQGLPFRGHTAEEGNFPQLLKLLSQEDKDLDCYLKRSISFTSPQAQEEIIQMFSRVIVRKIASDIARDGPFGIMVDGTQDINGAEQESICFRHVDENLNVHEDFVGLYELPGTTGEVVSKMILDVITRLSLSSEDLRAQTYDGAANMLGQYKGCQAKIKDKQPLALNFHCAAHVANLVMQHSITECPTLRDAIQWVHELGVLFKRSGKFKGIFQNIVQQESISDDQPMKPSTIRPLCPTRWLCRLSAILSVRDNYGSVLESLREMASSGTSETAAKANGLLDRFEKGETYLSLEMVTKPIAALEQLNRSFQSRSAVVSGMLEAVKVVTTQMMAWRTDEEFKDLFERAASKADELGLDELCLPRKRLPPRRLTGTALPFHPASPEQHFRQQYFAFIDAILVQLNDRYDPSQNDLASYKVLEDTLISGKVQDDQCIQRYPELKKDTLDVQVAMFQQTTKANSVQEAREAYLSMTPEVRHLFPQVVTLLKLLLVCPVTSSECERSFSTLRRLKTWLRSTMTQQRLNAVALCNSHHLLLEGVDIDRLANEFAQRNSKRRGIFGV